MSATHFGAGEPLKCVLSLGPRTQDKDNNRNVMLLSKVQKLVTLKRNNNKAGWLISSHTQTSHLLIDSGGINISMAFSLAICDLK